MLSSVIAVAAVALGGGLLLAATSIICDELSDKEREKQRGMREEYNNYQKEKQKEYEAVYNSYRDKRNNVYAKAQEELILYQKKLIENNKQRNRKFFNSYINKYNEQKNEKTELLSNLKRCIEMFEHDKEKQQNSYLRYRSLRQSLLTMQEAVYKLESYLDYLDTWKNNFEKVFNEEGEINEPFEFKLPEEYPHIGKVIHISRDALVEYNGGYNICLYKYRIWLSPYEIEVFKRSKDEMLPFMIIKNKGGKYQLSLIKGIIKNSIGGTTGFSAEVLAIRPKSIQLGVSGNEYPRIILLKSDLIKKNKRTPIGSSLQVFVKEHDFALQKIEVSEKPDEGMAIEQFNKILLVESKEDFHTLRNLYDYLVENKLLDEADEWRVAPLYKKHELIGFKMQQGANYAFNAFFDKSFGDEKLVLKFGGLIEDKKDFISLDDMFVTTNLSVVALNPTKIENDLDSYKGYFEECERLRLYLACEFSHQKRIMARTPISIYLNQWMEITKRLIEVKSFGRHTTIQIERYEQKSSKTILYIKQREALKRFIENRPKHSKYFLISKDEPEKKLFCRLCGLENRIEWVEVYEKIDDKVLLKNDFRFPLYFFEPMYAEQQQRLALDNFRQGKIVNDSIKVAIQNPRSLRYSDNGNRIQRFINQSIHSNPSQSDAVMRAFASKDFFIIQGPPGTGKTTVIKELVCQQLQKEPRTKILVVSQANVAVDNVIRGIATQNLIKKSHIIRCGLEEKLADDIVEYSFDTKIAEYQNKLIDISSLSPREQKLREDWRKILEDEKDKSVIGDCLLKQFQIIGATCVGLENRKYGLSDLKFDLVIIDEAGKALPGELLIPTNHAKKLIIIGDHKQLPPVVDPALYEGGELEYDDVVAQEDKESFVGKSLFYRLYEESPATMKCMLNTQFRMPPVIAELVNLFYDGELKTGENCKAKIPLFLKNNLIFIDMKNEKDYREEKQGVSVINLKEIEAVVAISEIIRKSYKKRIVIVTPYLGQKRKIAEALKKTALEDVYVNTIDALQGDEEYVVIYCTTRAITPTKYFSDAARLNVAFSRTKNTLIFLGSSDYLKKYKKGHIMQKVGDYLLKKSKMTEYTEWLMPSFDLQYNGCVLSDNTSHGMKLPNRFHWKKETPTTPPVVDNSFFDMINRKLEEREIEETSVCISCSRKLEKWENQLCSKCLTKYEMRNCRCCRETIMLSFYDKYIRNVSMPHYCDKCIEIQCEECKKTFVIPREKFDNLRSAGKTILCKDCFEYNQQLVLVGKCEECKKDIQYPRFVLNRNPNLKKTRLCKDCRNKVYRTIVCTVCGHRFQFTYGEKFSYRDKGLEEPKRCKRCRK